jgi:hypothetical protein
MDQQHAQPGLLVVEEHELNDRQVLIRHRDEAGAGQPRTGAAPLAGNELLVLATPVARRVSSFVDELPGLLRGRTTGVELLWLGVDALAADPEVALRLAKDLGLEIAAPDGGLAVTAGAALYAGHGVGGTGWHRFRPGQPVVFHGARFPLPKWETWLPAGPVALGGVVATPVPCGLLVRPTSAGSTFTSAFDVAVNQRFPKIVVTAGSAAEVARLLEGFPAQPVMVVPATPEAAAHTWQIELALRLSRDVVFSAGPQLDGVTVAPGGAFRPFPIVLQQSARGGDQEVLAVASPPTGWVREGHRSYRFADGDGEPVLADVVPSGLVLRTAEGEPDPGAEAAPFDPARWTLTLGAAGQRIGLPVLAAAEQLLASFSAEDRAVVRVRMAGIPDGDAEHALDRRAASRKQPPPPPPRRPFAPGRPVPRPSEQDSAAPRQSLRSRLGDFTSAPPVHPAAPPMAVAPPPIMTTSRAPVSTVSSTTASTVAGPPTAPPPLRAEPPAEPIRDELAEEPEAGPLPPAEPRSPQVTPPDDAPASPAIQPVGVPARNSTTAEQNRFVTAAGEDFGIALATVNAALATWPSMRAGDSPAGKADYIAVCLYLSRGKGAASLVNDVLRTGQGTVLDGQIPCLMSGLRRLPTHRRAVLRQATVAESLEQRGTPGTVLTEPGFLTASMDLDVTVPGADLDVLIWPASARRTSELMLGRPVGEAVFTAGARFKTLAVRALADEVKDDPEDDPDALSAPKLAVLFRELAPGEAPETTDLDDRDRAALAKLDTVLAGRRRTALRLVEDPDAVARLTTSMVLWQDEAAGEGKPVAVAS